MFITKKTHLAEVKRLEEKLEFQAAMYRAQADLYERQLTDLKKLVFLPATTPTREVLEVDAVFNASEKPVEMSEEDRNRILEGYRELDLLTSGNYDEDLLN